MTLSELRAKDVINTRDGRSLGRVIDVEFCLCDACQPGRITAIIVPGGGRPFSMDHIGHMLRGERAGIVIPWEMIRKIGDDVILVDVEIC